MNGLIAVVDDEPDIVELVAHHLRGAGFQVEGFADAESLFRFLEGNRPDLLILDVMLPGRDGLDICREVRRSESYSSVPIIMLTARVEEVDTVVGLELGADDYVTKPFSPRELVARVRAVLRRAGRGEKEGVGVIEVADTLRIDCGSYSVTACGAPVDLTVTEFRILKMLASRPGRVFTREAILNHLWGGEKIVLDRTVDVHIRNLRRKLGSAARFIRNIRGIGYSLET